MRSRLITAPLLLLLSAGIFAQTSNKTTPRKPAADAEAEKLAKERRAQVRSLLISLASDARKFSNDALRARSLARIADALWEVDAEESRSLFRKAWDAANLADKESQRRLEEDVRQQKSKTGGGFATTLPPNVRADVLQLVARRNRELGEEFLEQLKVEKKEELDQAAKDINRNPGQLSEALKERLNLASQLLRNGDVERAIQFADPALTSVSIQGLSFLSTLREKMRSLPTFATLLCWPTQRTIRNLMQIRSRCFHPIFSHLNSSLFSLAMELLSLRALIPANPYLRLSCALRFSVWRARYS